MSKMIIATESAPSAIGPYSQAVITGSMLYTSGQIPLDPATMEVVGKDIQQQAKTVLDNLMAILKAAGVDAEAVVKTTCFLSDMNNFAAFNEVYSEYFVENPPARSCVEVARLPKDVLIEVEAIAVLSGS